MLSVKSLTVAAAAPDSMVSLQVVSTARNGLVPHRIAQLATRALWDELALYPKPGLVSLRDAGSHTDMDASTFVRSLFALRDHFRAISAAGASAAPLSELRRLGLRAEEAMLAATGGVNTHRGAIFALGLLGAALARTSVCGDDLTDDAVRSTLKNVWNAALEKPVPPHASMSHGMQAAARYGAPGAHGEALAGFPSVFEVAIPALREAHRRGLDARRARLAAFFALLESVEDTNTLYRGGTAGLEYVHRSAREFLATGGVDAPDGIARAERIHRDFVVRGLSPGGCADLLASALFVDAAQVGAR